MGVPERRADVYPLLGRFLGEVRLQARPAHRCVYEELAWGLESMRRNRSRRAARLSRQDVLAFLAFGYLRQGQSLPSRAARRVGAAVRIFVRWWKRQEGEIISSQFELQVKRAARALLRAARASELLEGLDARGTNDSTAAQLDDYFEIVVRGTSHVVVRPLQSPFLIGPVPVSEGLAAALDPGALVNLRLTLRGGQWHIVDTGSCYPPSARAALVQSRASEGRP